MNTEPTGIEPLFAPSNLVFWSIFDHPLDHPDNFVVRRSWPEGAQMKIGPEVWLRNTLEEAREVIATNAPGLYRLDRQPGDPPALVEVWF